MPLRVNTDAALAAAEARSIVDESQAEGDADHIDRLADDLLKSLMTYEDGPHFGLIVIGQLRLIAQELRGAPEPAELRIDDRRSAQRPTDPRRLQPRKRYLLSGHLLFPGSENLLSVRVVNVSVTGAKLQLLSIHPISDRAKLYIPQLQIAEPVDVVWKALPELGVHFEKVLDSGRGAIADFAAP